VFEKTGVLGNKIDLVLAIIRMGLFYGDKHLVKKHVERAKTLVESGGDWDRRNRLKAYEGMYLLTARSYNLAAPLLLDSLSTFTSYELCTYSNLVIYAVLAGSVSLKRVDFKSKVVDAPEIKAILGDGEDKLLALTGAISAGPGADAEMQDSGSPAPASAKITAVNLTTLGSAVDQPEAEMAVDFGPLAQLVSSLYNGRYKLFFQALALVEEQFLTLDRYLHEHKGWFIREMRLRAYQQLLQSYRVVGLDSMAADFGVTVEFLDRYIPPPFPHPLYYCWGTVLTALCFLLQRPRQVHRRRPHPLHHRPRRRPRRHRDQPARRQEQAVPGRGAPGRPAHHQAAKVRAGRALEGERAGVGKPV